MTKETFIFEVSPQPGEHPDTSFSRMLEALGDINDAPIVDQFQLKRCPTEKQLHRYELTVESDDPAKIRQFMKAVEEYVGKEGDELGIHLDQNTTKSIEMQASFVSADATAKFFQDIAEKISEWAHEYKTQFDELRSNMKDFLVGFVASGSAAQVEKLQEELETIAEKHGGKLETLTPEAEAQKGFAATLRRGDTSPTRG